MNKNIENKNVLFLLSVLILLAELVFAFVGAWAMVKWPAGTIISPIFWMQGFFASAGLFYTIANLFGFKAPDVMGLAEVTAVALSVGTIHVCHRL